MVNVGKYIPYMDAMGLLMVQKSCDHQLMLVVYPIIYDVFFYMPGGDGRISEPSTVSMAQLGSLLWSSRSWWIFLFGMILLWFCYSLARFCYESCILLFLLNGLGTWKIGKNMFKCWRAMVFYGKQVKFRTTSKKSKDIALCTLLPARKKKQTTNWQVFVTFFG